MSSAPPPDQSQPSVPEEGVHEPEPDEADTGPLHIGAPAQSFDNGWGAEPADDWGTAPEQSTWAGRFDAPLTVSPRQVPRERNFKVLLYVAGAVVAVAAVAGLVVLFLRPSGEDPESPSAEPVTSTPAAPATPTADEQRLLRMVPRGYAADICEPAEASNDALAQVNCARNTDVGGPPSATYILVPDKPTLDAAFGEVMKTTQRVNCPGNIQSPGPWRRNATPQKTAGTLYCGLREGQPTVAWTDDARLVVSVAHAGPSGPTFPELYAWWASHS